MAAEASLANMTTAEGKSIELGTREYSSVMLPSLLGCREGAVDVRCGSLQGLGGQGEEGGAQIVWCCISTPVCYRSGIGVHTDPM